MSKWKLHICIFAYLHICIFANLHICIFANLHICIFADENGIFALQADFAFCRTLVEMVYQHQCLQWQQKDKQITFPFAPKLTFLHRRLCANALWVKATNAMGFKMCEKLSKVDVWFSLILTPTTKKMVPLNLKWPKFCVNFFGGNFHNYDKQSEKCEDRPRRGWFFCVITVWTMRRKKAQNIVVVWGYLHGEIELFKKQILFCKNLSIICMDQIIERA